MPAQSTTQCLERQTHQKQSSCVNMELCLLLLAEIKHQSNARLMWLFCFSCLS